MSDYFERFQAHLLDAVEREAKLCGGRSRGALRRPRRGLLLIAAVLLLGGSAAAAVLIAQKYGEFGMPDIPLLQAAQGIPTPSVFAKNVANPDALRTDERRRFLDSDWPKVRATIARLGLSVEQLLQAPNPPLPGPVPTANKDKDKDDGHDH